MLLGHLILDPQYTNVIVMEECDIIWSTRYIYFSYFPPRAVVSNLFGLKWSNIIWTYDPLITVYGLSLNVLLWAVQPKSDFSFPHCFIYPEQVTTFSISQED